MADFNEIHSVLERSKPRTQQLLEDKASRGADDVNRLGEVHTMFERLLSDQDLLDFLSARGEKLNLFEDDDTSIKLQGDGDLVIVNKVIENKPTIVYSLKRKKIVCTFSTEVSVKEGTLLTESDKYLPHDLTAQKIGETVTTQINALG